MANHVSILSQRWTDILPPSAPPPLTWWLLLSAGVLLLLAMGVVWLLWQQRPRQRGLRVLRRCRRQLLQSLSVDSRETALRIYRALLQGLAVSPACLATAAVHDPAWQAFYQRLQGSVFAADSPSRDELAELIRQAHYWLRHYR